MLLLVEYRMHVEDAYYITVSLIQSCLTVVNKERITLKTSG